MDVFAFSGLINGIAALSIGVLIITKDRHQRLNQLFFFMTLAIAVWAFGYWQWLTATDQETALFWIRIFTVGSLFIPVLYFHWVLYLLDLTKKKKILLQAVYAFALLLSIFSSSNFLIAGVEQKLFFPFWPNPGIFYGLYIAGIYICLVIYSFYLLAKAYGTASNERRGRIFYVLLGAVLGFGGASTNFLLWYNILIPPYGTFLVTLFPFLFGYAIIKHHLFDIKVVATELLTFAIWLFLLVRTLVAETWEERLIDGTLFLLVVFFGILLIRSVLKEVEAREEIEKLARELDRVNRAQADFLSMASHQLKTPLSIVKGYISMALEGSFGAVTKTLQPQLEKVYASNERLIRLVEDLLNLSRIEDGRMKYDWSEENMATTISSVVDELRERAEKKGLTLLWQPPETALRARVDAAKIRNVILNLIDNAIKYTEEGSITVMLKQEHSFLLFSVQDTGVGMVPGVKDSLFKKFTRADKREGQYAVGGFGLGLYIAKLITRDHHGEIWGESAGEWKGSTFYLKLPLVPQSK